jgi:glucose/arabinose dehydrogenase
MPPRRMVCAADSEVRNASSCFPASISLDPATIAAAKIWWRWISSAISPSTLTWYTGDKLLPWQGHLFVGALNGQTLVRVAFDQPMPQGERRDSLFIPLGRRWRHVEQSPDGYLYALTEKRTLGGAPEPADATSGVVYRIEPAE